MMKPAPLYFPLAEVLYLCAASCNFSTLRAEEAMTLTLYVSPECQELDKQQIVTLLILRQDRTVLDERQVFLPVVLSHNADIYINYPRITKWDVISDRSTDSWGDVEKHINAILLTMLGSPHRASVKFFAHGHPKIIQLKNVEFDENRKKCKVTFD